MADSLSDFEQLINLTGVVRGHLFPFLTYKEVGRLGQLSRECKNVTLSHKAKAWHVLYLRDFWEGLATDPSSTSFGSPIYSEDRRSFDTIVEQPSWKCVYEKWLFYRRWTHGLVQPNHCIEAIHLWRRLKDIFVKLGLRDILDSLLPCPEANMFQNAMIKSLPSALMALHSVHGGQSAGLNFLSGSSEALLGYFECYHEVYSMRLASFETLLTQESSLRRPLIFALSETGHFRSFLYLSLDLAETRVEDTIFLTRRHSSDRVTVGRHGVLSYLNEFAHRLEQGIYERTDFGSISLFPNAGESMSRCVTDGIEVRASARWLPQYYPGSVNFAYYIRIRILPERSIPCQLVGRRWEFIDGNGQSSMVTGEGVIGKHPYFFIDDDGKGSYIDLGHGCHGEIFNDAAFTYVSQTGDVAGISIEDTKCAGASGSFSFVPGTIEEPTGPPFDVTVGFFPFTIPSPFY